MTYIALVNKFPDEVYEKAQETALMVLHRMLELSMAMVSHYEGSGSEKKSVTYGTIYKTQVSRFKDLCFQHNLRSKWLPFLVVKTNDTEGRQIITHAIQIVDVVRNTPQAIEDELEEEKEDVAMFNKAVVLPSMINSLGVHLLHDRTRRIYRITHVQNGRAFFGSRR